MEEVFLKREGLKGYHTFLREGLKGHHTFLREGYHGRGVPETRRVEGQRLVLFDVVEGSAARNRPGQLGVLGTGRVVPWNSFIFLFPYKISKNIKNGTLEQFNIFLFPKKISKMPVKKYLSIFVKIPVKMCQLARISSDV